MILRFSTLGAVLTALLLPVAHGVFAAPGPSPLLALVRKNYSPQTSMETKFTLAIYWNIREKEENKQGGIVLAPRNRFRVTAGSETFVCDGQTCWTYNSAANQVTIKPLAAIDRSLHPSRIFEQYIVACPFREEERTGAVTRLLWKSDSAKAVYRSIEIWADTRSGVINKCRMTDRQDNTFTYSFSKTVFGKTYAKEAFTFAIPKNARVVDPHQ